MGPRRAGRLRRVVGRAKQEQLEPLDEVVGWSLDGETKRAIDEIFHEVVTDPIGPEFMAPPPRAPLRALMRGTAAS